MRRVRSAIQVALATLSLAGCAAAAAPVVTGGAVALPTATVPQLDPAADHSTEFQALVKHVQQRATLWREGAPINSLVLDASQTVLNPVAMDCARRPPLVIVDADPAKDAAPFDVKAASSWRQTLTAIRNQGVAILWVTDQLNTEVAMLRGALADAGIDSSDAIAGRAGAADRKQLIRQRWAQTHCILAVVGDRRSDADEAYDFLRSADAALPIDRFWGEGWFLLSMPPRVEGAE